jgi:PAS domain S-box-containing protein
MIEAEDGEIHSAQYRLATKDQSWIWLCNRCTIFSRNENGEVTHLLSVLLDITEQKRSESILNKAISELRMKNEIHAYAESIANMGTWWWKPDTGESFFSDHMFELFGIDRSVKPGFDTIPQYIHPEDRQQMLAMAQALINEEETEQLQYRVLRPDGAERIFINRCKLVKAENGERIFIGTTQDITGK